MFLLMQVLEVALRLALVAGFVVAVFALWVMLTDKDSPLARGCLNCDRNLSRGDVVHCANCLGAGR